MDEQVVQLVGDEVLSGDAKTSRIGVLLGWVEIGSPYVVLYGLTLGWKSVWLEWPVIAGKETSISIWRRTDGSVIDYGGKLVLYFVQRPELASLEMIRWESVQKK